MKIFLHLIFLTIILLFFSCKESTTEQKIDKTEKQVELKKTIESPKDSILNEKSIEVPRHYEHKFVIARSGLNYRDLPKGKVLGKFSLNTQLKIIEYTKIADQIKDGEKIIKGDWVGVQNGIDTVYVFNGFLSSSYIQSDIKLYNTSSYYKEKNGKITTAFLNVSETYFENTYSENNTRNANLILTDNDLSKDNIKLNQNQRKKLLNKLKITESYKVFVYVMKTDSVLSFRIKNLPAVARMNAYGPSSDYENKEHDYYFGFDLGKKITNWNNLVFIGKENPFQTGRLKPIIWKEVDTNYVHLNLTELENLSTIDLPSLKFKISYLYKQDDMEYYLLNKNRLIIVDRLKEMIVFNRIYYGGEGSSVTMPKMENDSITNTSQWTGKLFKNKPSTVFGFQYFSFGCESIDFLTETEPSIGILCDNRH